MQSTPMRSSVIISPLAIALSFFFNPFFQSRVGTSSQGGLNVG